MARVSRAQSERNREEIESASARLFRERGFAGVSVADLMGAAGLTHGGFYGHFESKDELAAIACDRMFADGVQSWTRRIEAGGLDALVQSYLAPKHVETPGKGCGAVALASDVAREAADKPVRASFASGVDRLIDLIAAEMPDDSDSRGAAIRLFTMMVGAVTLARATRGARVSGEILKAAKAPATRPANVRSKRAARVRS